jgi:endonuclease/exonuclease/phosphatase family metal-dependent hydrolase
MTRASSASTPADEFRATRPDHRWPWHAASGYLQTSRLAAIPLQALCAALALVFSASCDKKQGTPDWNTPGQAPPPPVAAAATAAPSQPVKESQAPPATPPAADAPASSGLRFITYNVENWLTMDRYVDRQSLKGAPKPDSEKRAVVQILSRHQPDVVGLCEIGSREDLADLQSSLKAGGLDLPHVHFAGGSDPVRHLGLLSRFAISSTATPASLDYQLNGSKYSMNRGILDATIQARGKAYRFLGVHLKSQREVEEGDQEKMRQHEAHLLRNHVDAILQADAKARLIVYGDFNDAWGTPAVKTIIGSYNDPGYLTAIRARDRAGVHWTHYWEIRDIYSRFDFITVSQSLKRDVDFDQCRILDDPEWKDASDHRPVLAIFR